MHFQQSNFLTDEGFNNLSESVSRFYQVSKLEVRTDTMKKDNFTPAEGRYIPNTALQKAKRVRFFCTGADVEAQSAAFLLLHQGEVALLQFLNFYGSWWVFTLLPFF